MEHPMITRNKARKQKRTFGQNVTNVISNQPNHFLNNQNKARVPLKRKAFEINLSDAPPAKRCKYNLRSRKTSKNIQIKENFKNSEIENKKHSNNMYMNNNIFKTRKVDEWDKKDIDNELEIIEYIPNIMERFFEVEEQHVSELNDYMSRQNDINNRMRTILLDWLIDVHRKFELTLPTLYLTVNLLDRFLNKIDTNRNELQLTGCACMWLASKYHELYAPEIRDFVYISDNAFNEQDLITKESQIVKILEFDLTVPTSLSFAERFIKIGIYKSCKKNDKKRCDFLTHITHYLLEHCLMDYKLSNTYRPSKLAAACLCYSLLGGKEYNNWNDLLIKHTHYNLEQLKNVILQIDAIVKRKKDKCKHKAVRKKYSSKKYSCVSTLKYTILNCNQWFKNIPNNDNHNQSNQMNPK